jgi:hypothetical protein
MCPHASTRAAPADVDHARQGDAVFMDHGATRILPC